MATTKKTATTTKKTTTRTAKPKLTVVKPEEAVKQSVFEKMAARFPISIAAVDIGIDEPVNVRSRIGYGEAMMLMKQVIDVCVDQDRGTVSFELFDYAMKMAICSVYCDIPAPEDVEAGYAAVCGTNRMYELIAQFIDADQLDMLWGTTRAKILAQKELFNSAAAKLVIEMIQRMNELVEVISSTTSEFDAGEVSEALAKLGINPQ